MSPRGVLAVSLVVVVVLGGFGAFLLNVPVWGVITGSLAAMIGVVWATSRRRPKKAPETSPGPK